MASGRRALHDQALVEHGHPVRDPEDFRDLVAHHHRGEPELPVQLHDQVMDGVDQDRVQAGGGLVEEDHLRLRHQRPRDGHPLAHAARDLGRVLVPHPLEAHLRQLLLHPLPDLGGREADLLSQAERPRCPHTDMESKRAPPWNTTPYRSRMRSSAARRSRVISVPSTTMRPASGRSRPTRCLSSTDLPPPLRPMITMISPEATSRSRPRSTGCAPNERRRPSTLITATPSRGNSPTRG